MRGPTRKQTIAATRYLPPIHRTGPDASCSVSAHCPVAGGQPSARRFFSCPVSRRSPITCPREPVPVGLPLSGGALLAGASRDRFLPGRVTSPEHVPLKWQVASQPPFQRRRQTFGKSGPSPGVRSPLLLVARPLLARESGKPWQGSFAQLRSRGDHPHRPVGQVARVPIRFRESAPAGTPRKPGPHAPRARATAVLEWCATDSSPRCAIAPQPRGFRGLGAGKATGYRPGKPQRGSCRRGSLRPGSHLHFRGGHWCELRARSCCTPNPVCAAGKTIPGVNARIRAAVHLEFGFDGNA
jgi:hypothetical protein